MPVASKVSICNQALSRLGQYGSIENIDTPTKPTEITCALWWDTAREMALKIVKPNFALRRRYIAVSTDTPIFGYTYQYRYPSDCIHFLGIGEINDKENNYIIEAGTDGELYIQTDAYAGEPLPCRFVIDVPTVSRWTPEFVYDMAWFLGECINMQTTGDVSKQNIMQALIDKRNLQASSLNAMENRPIRKNVCHFAEARINGFVGLNVDKK